MKFLGLILGLGSLFAACGGKGETIKVSSSIAPDKAAEMEFKETAHNFGTLMQGDTASHVFTFTNTSKNLLTIVNAQGSCGCTIPEYPKEPIAPGETGKIKVTFNSVGKRGYQKKDVTIEANTIPSKTVLKIYANVSIEENSE